MGIPMRKVNKNIIKKYKQKADKYIKYILLCLNAFLCTGGDSTFSLSILKVSKISSFLICSMVSAISLALPPRFLVNVSFKCSRRLFGVVVLEIKDKTIIS